MNNLKEILINQLISIKAQVNALESQVDAALSLLSGEKEPCTHENKINLSTMGQERWHCKDCGYLYEEVKS